MDKNHMHNKGIEATETAGRPAVSAPHASGIRP